MTARRGRLATLAAEAEGCRACDLWARATQTVFGEGPASARVVLFAMGATAGQALFGGSFRVGAARGQPLELDGRAVVATIHPSAILRADGDDRAELQRGFVVDLACARELAA